MRTAIERLAAQMEREIGHSVTLRAPAVDTAALPTVLVPLYQVSDGLTLPFGEVARAAEVKPAGADWVDFGGDASSRFLCRRSPEAGLSITSWDGRSTIGEPLFATVEDWLASEYTELLEQGDTEADFVLTDIPVSKIAVVAELKDICPLVTRELLEALDKLPFRIPGVRTAAAIHVVRKLHAMGVACRLEQVQKA
jgi:hypothetical protein